MIDEFMRTLSERGFADILFSSCIMIAVAKAKFTVLELREGKDAPKPAVRH